jgi:hypothetical protein
MELYRNDFTSVIEEFKKKSQPNDRYTSFDYCYGYFKTNSGNDLTNNMQLSCLNLGFYLASWGMLRGSSYLLNKSVKHFEPTIDYISNLDKEVWSIDVDSYNDDNIEIILEIYNKLKETLSVNNHSHLTLITKVMLGVFGFIPAYDRYFCETMKDIFPPRSGFSSVNKKSLNNVNLFYQSNQEEINHLSNTTFITDFNSGQKSLIKYPKAKIIDMYGFLVGIKN